VPTFAELVDDFEDGTLDTSLWSGSYGDPDEVGGRARIPCTTGYAGLKSGSVYTLTGSGITIRLHPPAPNGAVSAVASCLVLTSTGGTDAGFIVDSAQTAVGLYLREGYADGAAVFLTYNSTDHAWLRFRESAGTLYWDTSPDGVDWTNRRTATTPAWAADTNLAFLIEGHRDAGADDFIEVDAVNAPPLSTVTGAADLAAEGDLATSGTRRALAATTLTAISTTTATAILQASSSAALDGVGILTAAAVRRATGAVLASSASDLAAAGTRAVPASTTLAAAASLTIAEAAIDCGFTIGAPTLGWEVGEPWL
jgi:hypothetical protein